jgi:hypothetical protein
MGLHADASVGIVEPLGADQLDRYVRRRAPGLRRAQSAMSAAFVGVIVAAWKMAIAAQR